MEKMEKIKIKLKECCLSCEYFMPDGVISLVYGQAGEKREISCGHMGVCWKYNAKKLDSQTPKKPRNLKKEGNKILNAECPSCGYSFPDIGGISESYGEVEQYDFCPECGQNIDWDEA